MTFKQFVHAGISAPCRATDPWEWDARMAQFAGRVARNVKVVKAGTDFRTGGDYAIVQIGGQTIPIWPHNGNSPSLESRLASLHPLCEMGWPGRQLAYHLRCALVEVLIKNRRGNYY